LLTGSTPITKEQLREAGFEEMLRTIRETEPPKPSKRLSDSGKSLPSISAVRNTEPAKLSKLIRGDLDWIVMKALDKQRARRYQTANDLVRDIERYMADEPVEARPPSAMYQLHKFVRKYRRAISIAAGFAFVLCLGGVVSTWQAIRAYRSAESARKAEIQASADRQLAEEKAMAHEQTQAALARERRLFYFNRVVLADRELQSNNIARTKQLLNECPEELRRWEWSYLHGICQQELFSLEHHSPVTAVAFSPDGTLIASGTYDGAIHIWDGMTRQNIRTLTGQSVTISDLAFSPDGQRLVSSVGHESVRHGGIKIWDVPSGQKVADVESVNYGVTSIAISPDGHYMAFVYGTFGTAEITIWDLAAQKPFRVLHGHTGPVSDVAFSPDSQRLVSGGFQQPSLSEDLPGEFRVWNVSTGDELLKQTAPFGPVSTVAYSPDGQFIATSGVDRTLRVWDATTGQERIKLTGHTRDVGCVAFLSQSLLASASHDCSIKLWDPRYEHKSVTLRGHTDFITSLAVDPKRDRVASAGADGTVKLWDTTDEDVFTLRGHEMEVGPVAFSPDGKVLASTGRQGELRIWDADSGLCIYASDPGRFNNAAHSLTFSPDDRSLAALVDGAVWILEAATGRKILECPEKGATATALDFSPDGKTVAALSLGKELNDKGEIRTWNAATGQLVQRFAAHLRVGHKVGCIKYSRDGTRLVTSCTENTARVWDATTGQQIFLLEGHTEPVLGIAISPDDRYIATASDDNYIKLWKLDTGQEVRTLKGHTQDVISVAFSPDGQRLISGANDSMVKLWDVESGEEAITLRGHLGRVRGVAFSRDGERVAAGSEDANIRIWSTVPLTEDMRSRRHAARIVNELASRPLVREDVVTAIQAQENIDTPTRQHALDLATRYQENANFHFNASMSVATRPDATQAEYEAGLRLAESAARLLPNDNSHLNMVGMAKYRVGDYRSAVEILTKTDAVYVKFHEGGVPFNLAYLAMAYHRLGEHDQALRTLDRLDRMMAPPAPEDDSHAESKNESDGTTKPKKWDYTKPEFGLYQSMHKEAAAVLRVGHTIDSANGRGTHRRSEILRRMRIDRWLPKLT
jgi:WD40 repeat protein